MTTQQGELLIRQKNPKRSGPSGRAPTSCWPSTSASFSVLRMRSLTRCWSFSSRGRVGYVDGARDACTVSVVTDAPPPRSFLPAAARRLARAARRARSAPRSTRAACASSPRPAARCSRLVEPRALARAPRRACCAPAAPSSGAPRGGVASARARRRGARRRLRELRDLKPRRRRRTQESSVHRCAASCGRRGRRPDPGSQGVRPRGARAVSDAVRAPRRARALATGPDESGTLPGDGMYRRGARRSRRTSPTATTCRRRARSACARARTGTAWPSTARPSPRRHPPLAAERLDAIARRVALLGLAAKDARRRRGASWTSARARGRATASRRPRTTTTTRPRRPSWRRRTRRTRTGAAALGAGAARRDADVRQALLVVAARGHVPRARRELPARPDQGPEPRATRSSRSRPSTSCGTATPPASRRTTASGRDMSAATRGTGSRSRGRPTRAATRSRWS